MEKRVFKCFLFLFIMLGIFVSLFFAPFLFSKPKKILLGFDTEDGHTNKEIRDLLGILAVYEIKATFFVMGQLAKERPYIVKEIYDAGNEVACHSFSHPNLKKINYSMQEWEIEECMSVIKNVTGELPTGFRAPFRRENLATQRILREHGFNYDSSAFENQPFFPKPEVFLIKTSSYIIFPLSDHVMLRLFGVSPSFYFKLLVNKPGKVASFAFHPNLILKYKSDFDSLLKYWSLKRVNFITHEEYYRENFPQLNIIS